MDRHEHATSFWEGAPAPSLAANAADLRVLRQVLGLPFGRGTEVAIVQSPQAVARIVRTTGSALCRVEHRVDGTIVHLERTPTAIRELVTDGVIA